MDIGVIGAGYVGLITAAGLAEIGHRVICVDEDLRKIEVLNSGGMPFYEPNLADLVERNRQAKRLEFIGQVEDAVAKCQVIFICVGTPPLENGEADLSFVELVARRISGCARGYHLVIEKSTVPVQTGRRLQKHFSIYANNSQFRCDVASNPEFLREGSGVEDFFHPDRIVIGVDSEKAAELLEEVYQPVLQQSFACPVHANCWKRERVPFVVTDINSAELIKHASNSFLATKISFINMIADLCEAVGADVGKVAEAVGMTRGSAAASSDPAWDSAAPAFPRTFKLSCGPARMRAVTFPCCGKWNASTRPASIRSSRKSRMSFGWYAENGSRFGDSPSNLAPTMSGLHPR